MTLNTELQLFRSLKGACWHLVIFQIEIKKTQ
jgi:hypothetical protein